MMHLVYVFSHKSMLSGFNISIKYVQLSMDQLDVFIDILSDTRARQKLKRILQNVHHFIYVISQVL